MWPGAADTWPTDNWKLCNGQAVSRTTYASLFAIIGTTFGSGDGSTTFNLPNLLERFVVGAGGENAGVTGSAYSVGDTGGANSVTLDTTQMPVHTHTTSIDGYQVEISGSLGGAWSMGPGNRPQNSTAFSMNNAGGSGGTTQSHENRPPYIALMHIIRVQ